MSEEDTIIAIHYPTINDSKWSDTQQQIRALHRKIDTLQKRLNDTKIFCDSLWEELKDRE